MVESGKDRIYRKANVFFSAAFGRTGMLISVAMVLLASFRKLYQHSTIVESRRHHYFLIRRFLNT
jgi:hypothetical protein